MINKLASTYADEKKKLMSYIGSEIHNDEEAEDIYQEIFSIMLSKLNVLDNLNNTGAWLMTMAKNKIIDWYRKKENQNRSLTVEEVDGSWDEILIESGIDVENEYMRKILGDTIVEAIDNLPEEQKEIFVANVIDGITFREISEATGITLSTLISRKQYALEKLRVSLREIKRTYINKG